MNTPLLPLIHGASLPGIGLGTYPMTDDDAPAAVRSAIEVGYRLIDTAHGYHNETGVGLGIRDAIAGGVAREELFITTKFNKDSHFVAGVATAWETSCRRLGLDYLDLMLIHWPCPMVGRYVEAWEGLIALLAAGKVRAIGVSNFLPAHLDRIVAATGVAPDVNQIKFSPYALQGPSVAANRALGTITEAYSPIKPATQLTEPAVLAAAKAHGVTPAQTVLRWVTQHGIVPIPKSSNPARQAENLAIFNFTLTAAEMASLDALDRGTEFITDSNNFGH
ncbi:MAG: aldo/keto reductase [Promicromonosporaceae bacterium]|nr:aldo/keto reductase [Promicromonosporaceae bacterium]